MQSLNHHEVMVLFLALGFLLLFGRLFGEIARRLHQPAVLGEILAGILLGPTILGEVAPDISAALFPSQGPNAIALGAVTTICLILFLLAAGMEVDLSTVFRLRGSALIIAISGILIPFALGYAAASASPQLLGMEPGAQPRVFALFMGTALAICALPVIAKILMDLNLFRSDMGMVIISVAIVHDLVGWLIFANVLALMQPGHSAGGATQTIFTLALTIGFAALLLTGGRALIDRTLPWLQASSRSSGAVLSFALVLALLCASVTEWIGIHAIFGAFLAGVALGDSAHLQNRTRGAIEQFIGAVFAPMFFASIGLRVNFFDNFDLPLVLTVIVIATLGGTFGTFVGAKFARFPWRESWALGFALNARGAMEIVLALLALQYGLIGERLFVALVVMALVTSVIAGPLMQWMLQLRTRLRFTDYIVSGAFVGDLRAETKREAIARLSHALANSANLDASNVEKAVWAREELVTTAVGNGLAIPHARISGISKPMIAIGLAYDGVPFDAIDDEPARLILLLLTPEDKSEIQLDIMADIARSFQDPASIRKALAATSLTLFRACVHVEAEEARAAAAQA